MQIHELKNYLKRNKKRVGRGGKRGTYSGRGIKGQKARTGHRIRPAERDLLMRLPKLRGYRNKPLRDKFVPVNLDDLNRRLGNELVINRKKSLLKAGFIKKAETAKILGRGEVIKPYSIIGIPVSRNAREKIKKAGGKVI